MFMSGSLLEFARFFMRSSKLIFNVCFFLVFS